SNTVLFVDTGTHRILVDSGFGEKLGPLFGNYSYLQANLRRAGISPDSIDLVIISHGHVDHIAGLLNDKGSLAYPNARLAFVDQEWDYWKGSRFESEINGSLWPDGFKVAQVATVKTVLPTVESRLIRIKAGGEIVPGVHYVAAPGHSPAHSAILFESGGQQLMYLADVAHHPVTSLQRPEWTPVVDYDAALSVKTRRALLDRVATDRSLVMNYHFPFPAIGHVVRDKDAYRWEATQWVW
ncbi:MBL fold metallo-hydrolase, partial [Bosea sp. TAB14]|uniref:MBL fold metallo-hydrolase n=1 Tax=Bosea sp. TAB14 TaxID=3237481 RepID=UPI003F934956